MFDEGELMMILAIAYARNRGMRGSVQLSSRFSATSMVTLAINGQSRSNRFQVASIQLMAKRRVYSFLQIMKSGQVTNISAVKCRRRNLKLAPCFS